MPVQPEVSVIVPARNEEASLGACLASLVSQAGVEFEVIVVNDGSTDRSGEIAASFAGVKLLYAPLLPPNWVGKNHALACGAAEARGSWLLFTDADTVHAPGSLARALAEARAHGAALLSYSPEQEVRSLAEKAVMPVIFSELASQYKPSEVSDPASPAAAANGQYLLISRQAYDAIGGHAAVANCILEDVALAAAVKRSGGKIYFRFANDAVRTRMYRSLKQLIEGWTKNLTLLFPSPGRLAAIRLGEFLAIAAAVWLAAHALAAGSHVGWLFAACAVLMYSFLIRRIRKAHFSWDANVLAFFGLPLFAYLLVRSKMSYQRGTVSWKGRDYAPEARPR